MEESLQVVRVYRKPDPIDYKRTFSSLEKLKDLEEELEKEWGVKFKKLGKLVEGTGNPRMRKKLEKKLKGGLFKSPGYVEVFVLDFGNGPLSYYLGWCKIHRRYFTTYPQGYERRIECPSCEEEFLERRFGGKRRSAYQFLTEERNNI